MNLQALKTYLLDRCREPSTWRGVVLVATALGASLSPEATEAIVTVGIGLAGVIGAAVPDKKDQSNADH